MASLKFIFDVEVIMFYSKSNDQDTSISVWMAALYAVVIWEKGRRRNWMYVFWVSVCPPELSKNKWLVVRQWRKNVYKVPQIERSLPDNFLHFQQALFKLKCEIWAISSIKFIPFSPPGPNPPTACIYPWGLKSQKRKLFPYAHRRFAWNALNLRQFFYLRSCSKVRPDSSFPFLE